MPREFTPFRDMWQVLAGDLGITTKRMRESALERAAAEQELLSGMDQSMARGIQTAQGSGGSELDTMQLGALRDRYTQLRNIASQHPDSDIREKAFEELTKVSGDLGAWYEDVESRRESVADAQRSNMMTAATDLRNRYNQAQEDYRALQSNANQLHRLLNDEGFDPNSPLNRGQVITLLNATSRQMLTDPDGFDDALSNAGGGGLIGSLAALASGLMKEEEFKFTKEDIRRIATAQYDFAAQRYTAETQRIAQGTQLLDQAGKDVFAPGYSITNYVLGQEQEFETPYRGEYQEPAPRQVDSAVNTVLNQLTTTEKDQENPIPLWEGVQSMWNLDLRKQPDESSEAYRARLKARREARTRRGRTHVSGIIQRPTNE